MSRRAFWNLSITGPDPKLSADKVAQCAPSQKAGQPVVFFHHELVFASGFPSIKSPNPSFSRGSCAISCLQEGKKTKNTV